MILQNALWLDFPADAAERLDVAARALLSDPTLARSIADAEDALFDDALPESVFFSALEGIANATELDQKTTDLIVLLHAVDRLRGNYRARGISEEVCRATLRDLKYKHAECMDVYGVDGTFVTDWFPRHFRCRLFALGRLQYERFPFGYNSYGTHLKKGDTVYKCHIPSCGPITTESVIDSLRQAHAFFREELRDGILPVFCSSWMLYPPHNAEVFPAGSNLNRFYELFDVIDAVPLPKNEDFWRVFNMPYSPEALENAPERTSLQRAFKRYLQSGACMGSGKGILLFDGRSILPKENS